MRIDQRGNEDHRDGRSGLLVRSMAEVELQQSRVAAPAVNFVRARKIGPFGLLIATQAGECGLSQNGIILRFSP